MRKKLIFLAFITVSAAAQLGLFSARPAHADECWWVCCPGFDFDPAYCTVCCVDRFCWQPTCPT